MTIPGGFGDLDFREWGLGLVASFVSGGASAVTSGFTVSALDPKDYNFQDGLSKLLILMGAMFLVNGIMSMMLFLRQKPVPDHKLIKTTIEETVVQPALAATKAHMAVPEMKVVTTVEEQKKVPVEKPTE